MQHNTFSPVFICFLLSTVLLWNFTAMANDSFRSGTSPIELQNTVWKHVEQDTDGNFKFRQSIQSSDSNIISNGFIGLFSTEGTKIPVVVSGNSDLAIANWRMNLSSDFQLSFMLQTELGRRQITYTSSNKNTIEPKKSIFSFGLGSFASTGKWVSITRNLANDLKQVEPANRITAITFVFIKGRGEVANFNLNALKIRAPSEAPAPTTFASRTPQTPEASLTTTADISALESEEPELAAALPGRGGARRVLNLRSASAKKKQPLTIDGAITEAAWQSAEVADDFRVSEKRIFPSSKTEVKVLSDDENLYFAFKCFDDNPDLVTAIKTLRDGGLGTDDAVSVIIDSYKNHNTAAIYSLNARGTKDDQLPGSGNKKIQWKGDWRGAAKITGYGWSAEIAIPFNILKFSPDAESFGINFSRHQHRTLETSHWVKPTTDKQNYPLGFLAGFILPQAKTGRIWTMMPYVVAGKNTLNRDGEVKENSLHGGVTLRYEPLNNLTGLMEILPDFSQVESQISDIDFSYNEKEIDDTRTFFQEGSSNFEPDSEYFYSPRIPDFDVGVKTFMQNESNVLGILATGTEDGRQDFHARYRRNLPANAGLTLTAVHGNQDDTNASLLAAGIDKKYNSGIFFDLKGAWAQNEANESAAVSQSGKLLFGLSKNLWEVGVNSDYYAADYNPPTTFLKSDLPGTRSNGVYASIYKEGHGAIKEINGNVTYTNRNTLDGEEQNDGFYLSTDFEVLGKARLQLAYSDYDYRPLGGTPGVFANFTNNDKYLSTNLDFNIYSARFGYGGFAAEGELGGGDYRYLSGYIWFNPTTSTSLKVATEDLTSFGRFKQTTFSGGWDFSKNDGLLARLSKGEAYEQLRLAYRRKVISGMDVFLSFQKQNGVKDEYTGKFVWTF